MRIKYILITLLAFHLNTVKAQFTVEGVKYFQELCVSEKYLNHSFEHISRFRDYYLDVKNLNLSSKQKWDYVREKLKTEDDEIFLSRKNRDIANPVTSNSEMIKRKIIDMTFDISRIGALVVFNENIDPVNSNRINRRIVEECNKLIANLVIN